MPRSAISVDPRLFALSELCGKCRLLADIGCDHGRLGAYMLQKGLCERVQFADISEASLEKARRLVSTLGLLERASFHLGDGAEALAESPDACVVAGMGGLAIAGIVARGLDRLKGARLILQPNVAAMELREALVKLGFFIADEKIVRDGRRLYPVIAAEAGAARYDETQFTVGPVLMERRPVELRDYAKFKIRVAKKALSGMEKGCADGEDMRRELLIWEEVARWYG
jgi:tRNA (adenine22-N1)-methyltransferase